MNSVVDTVRHRMVAGPAASLFSEDARYRAAFDARGFAVGLVGKGGGELRVSASHLAVGSTSVELSAGGWQGRSNVAQRSLGSGVMERVTATGGQLEWDVVLQSQLPGSGDLRIDSDVTGAAGSARSGPGGLRWDLGHGRALVMGALAVKDRTGAVLYRTVPRVDGSTVRLTVPASVLRGAAYPLTVDPVVSPEYPVSDAVSTTAPEPQQTPAVAFDGTNYLVVWSDGRAQPHFSDHGGFGTDLYGARVTPSGTVLDGAGIPISTVTGNQDAPVIAYDGTNFLVAWSDSRTHNDYDVYAATVSTAGVVGTDFPIATGTGDQLADGVAFNGTNYLVVWEGAGVFGSRVSPAGTVLAGSGFSLAPNTAASQATVAANGANFFVAYTRGDSGAQAADIRGTRVTGAGNVVDPSGIVISAASNNQMDPSVAFDGTNNLVTWTDSRSGVTGGSDIYGARVTTAGVVVDPSGIPIIQTSDTEVTPKVAFNGAAYLVVWFAIPSDTSAHNSVYAKRVSTAGAILDPSPIVLTTRATYSDSREGYSGVPAVGAGSSANGFFVAWSGINAATVDTDLLGARVSTAGADLDNAGIIVARAANSQQEPAVAFDGTNYLVVWSNDDRQPAGMYAARVSSSGTILDGAGFLIPKGGGQPSVAFDGTNFLVVWTHSAGSTGQAIYGARVSTSGSVLNTTPIIISYSDGSLYKSDPALAFDGTNFLVVWSDNRPSAPGVYGTRVSKAGVVQDPSGIRISNNTSAIHPALAFDGTNYLVTWTFAPSYTEADIYGARVSKAGVVQDPSGIAISTAPGYQDQSAVAFDGTNYLVAWSGGPSGPGIFGARVSKAGVTQDPSGIAISSGSDYQATPSAAFDGTNFLVLWIDQGADGDHANILGNRVSDAGSVVGGGGFVVVTKPRQVYEFDRAPALAAGNDGKVRVVYTRYAPEAGYGSYRAFLRTISPK